MNYIEFENQWRRQGVFSIHELRLWCREFDRNNLTRWIAKGYVARLRNGWYALREALARPEISRYIANRIYMPSYISLETALCAYDIIPEAVVDITSITSKKTNRFSNEAGDFYYYSVKPELMFGYKPVRMIDGLYYMLAEPEKAILDFLYLHPEYSSSQDMLELRFDELFLDEELDLERFSRYLEAFRSKALKQRIETFKKVYGI